MPFVCHPFSTPEHGTQKLNNKIGQLVRQKNKATCGTVTYEYRIGFVEQVLGLVLEYRILKNTASNVQN